MITLFLDLDGVIANFQKAYVFEDWHHPENNNRFRHAVMERKIFENLELMPDAPELLYYITTLKNVNVEILTSVGTTREEAAIEAERQKRLWLKKVGIHYKPNFVNYKAMKAAYARPQLNYSLDGTQPYIEEGGNILVDDSPGCINPFQERGGVGILHTSAADTIIRLENVLDRFRDFGYIND